MNKEQFNARWTPEPFSGCWIWTRGGTRYGSLRINKRKEQAHRVAWQIYKGEIPAGLWVLHTCDNPFCVNPGHLFLGTHKDNMRDMKNKRRGRGGRGMARLTPEQVREIKLSSNTGASFAKKFGVCEATVSYIRTNQTWKHI